MTQHLTERDVRDIATYARIGNSPTMSLSR